MNDIDIQTINAVTDQLNRITEAALVAILVMVIGTVLYYMAGGERK